MFPTQLFLEIFWLLIRQIFPQSQADPSVSSPLFLESLIEPLDPFADPNEGIISFLSGPSRWPSIPSRFPPGCSFSPPPFADPIPLSFFWKLPLSLYSDNIQARRWTRCSTLYGLRIPPRPTGTPICPHSPPFC